MQALVDASSGPVPPLALLPIIRAKETGPAATDVALEVLERITGEAENGSGGGSGGGSDGSKQAVIGERSGARCCHMSPGEKRERKMFTEGLSGVDVEYGFARRPSQRDLSDVLL